MSKAARREAVLNDLADEQIEADDRAAALRLEQERTAAEAAKLRGEIRARIDGLGKEHVAVISRAEAACRELAAALGETFTLGRTMAGLYSDLGEAGPAALSGPAAEHWFGACISATLKPVTGHPIRLGQLKWARSWRRPEQPWTERSGPAFKQKDDLDDRLNTRSETQNPVSAALCGPSAQT